MEFWNLSSGGLYLCAAHRTLSPGECFRASLAGQSSRSLASLEKAGSSGAFSVVAEPGEEVPAGFRNVVSRDEVDRFLRGLDERRRADAEAEELRSSMAEEVYAENMRVISDAVRSSPGLPDPVLRSASVRSDSVVTAKAVTSADIISEGDRPASIEAIRRHNKASAPRRGSR